MKTNIRLRVGLGIFFVLAPIALLSPAADVAAQTPAKSIVETLKPFVDSQTLAGAVALVADKDKVLSVDAVGYADVAAQRPMMVDMIFWIASMSKPITAVVLMMLVDEGKVKLDDPVEKYLPEFKEVVVAPDKDSKELRKPNHPITVREVLSHTSGLPHILPQEKPMIDVLPLKDAVKNYTKAGLLHQPGSKYLYSNAGINTAGRIVEVVSGMSFEDFLDKRLFGPLGMTDTTFWPSEAQVKLLAKSYKPNKDKTGLEETTIPYLKYPLSDRQRHPCPGGGLFSTASDCGVFCQMLLGGGVYKGKRYLSESALKELSRRQTGPDLKTAYGLGFTTSADSFGHGGAYATNMTVHPKRGLVTVWMVQHAGFPGNGSTSQGAFRKTAEELYGKTSQ